MTPVTIDSLVIDEIGILTNLEKAFGTHAQAVTAFRALSDQIDAVAAVPLGVPDAEQIT